MIELLSGVACFLDIVNSIFSLVNAKKISSKEDSKVVSDFLNDIGVLLREVADNLEQNRYPHEKCSIMFEYMNGMKNVLKDKMEENQLQQLQESIENSYRVEQLLGQLNQLTSEQKSYNIDTIRSIAGRFVGISRLLNVN